MKKIIVIAGLFFAFSQAVWAQKIKGNGDLKEKEISVGSFQQIRLQSCLNLVITDEVDKVKIQADGNLLPLIEVKVEAGVLIIKDPENKWFSSKNLLMVYVPAQPLSGLENFGSGNITAENAVVKPDFSLNNRGAGNLNLRIQAKRVKINDFGSGNLTLTGQAESLQLTSGGSGNLNGQLFKINEAEVEINGSGNVALDCQTNLTVTIGGTGNLSYSGSPQVSTQLSGTGKVRKSGR
jgi:hypothetical protein